MSALGRHSSILEEGRLVTPALPSSSLESPAALQSSSELELTDVYPVQWRKSNVAGPGCAGGP